MKDISGISASKCNVTREEVEFNTVVYRWQDKIHFFSDIEILVLETAQHLYPSYTIHPSNLKKEPFTIRNFSWMVMMKDQIVCQPMT